MNKPLVLLFSLRLSLGEERAEGAGVMLFFNFVFLLFNFENYYNLIFWLVLAQSWVNARAMRAMELCVFERVRFIVSRPGSLSGQPVTMQACFNFLDGMFFVTCIL